MSYEIFNKRLFSFNYLRVNDNIFIEKDIFATSNSVFDSYWPLGTQNTLSYRRFYVNL
jgi:hypothetical protein